MIGFYLLVAHCIGDYIIQNDWMAAGKKKSSLICAIHSILYTTPFVFCGLDWYQLFLILGQHHLQDRGNFIIWYMNKFGKKEFTKPPLSPWSFFAVDNSFHLLWIAIVTLL